MNILVTGAAGFIGFHLTKKLVGLNHKISAIDNLNDYYDPKLKYDRLRELGLKKNAFQFGEYERVSDNLIFYRLDLRHYQELDALFKNEKFDCVLHMAAQAGVRYSIESPFSYVESNLVGFSNILELCRQHDIPHLIYASSSSVYGDSKEVPFIENQPTDSPVSLYAATKKSNEVMAHAYHKLYGFKATGLRFFTVYGPWGRPDMAPILFANAITASKPIKVFNHGNMLRDFTYIDDIIEGIIRLLEKPVDGNFSNEVFNIGNSSPIKLMDFIQHLENELGISADIEMKPMQPGDVKQTYADTSKLQNAIGYKPSTSLEEGLRKFATWYKNYYAS